MVITIIKFDLPVVGMDEGTSDQLRSILAQFEHSYHVCLWEEKGVPFKTYYYVPEVHPLSGTEYHEREDDAHVLKVCISIQRINVCKFIFYIVLANFILYDSKQRIATSTRCGGPQQLRLERFKEALEDSSSGLTYTALTGKNKQSVRDAERMFSFGMLRFMKSKGYSFEAKYIETILNWRRASDERGLSELQRCRYNYEMLSYINEELFPGMTSAHWRLTGIACTRYL